MKKQACHFPSWHGRPAHDGPQAILTSRHNSAPGIGLRPIIGGTPMPQMRLPRGFSLMEVLLAVFILGIGLIMVATIFPVGADWTRQSAEDSIAQSVAQNALTIIQDAYAPTNMQSPMPGAISNNIPPTNTTLQALPSLALIPVSERAYQFGSPTPFPAPNPKACSYFWTALVRAQPGQLPAGQSASASTRYDLYILVFRKGDVTQTFRPPGEFSGVRDAGNPTMSYLLEPTLVSGMYAGGTTGVVPPVGYIGVGQQSGTVFRQSTAVNFATGTSTAVARPRVANDHETVIFAAPADGTTASPLIYVFQTTLSF